MIPIYLPRRLVHGETRITQAALLQLSPVVLVLAEPGAGKSELLNELARSLGTKRRSASRFRHQTLGAQESALIIDGLDEIARLDPNAVDPVIVKASEAAAKTVVLSSRSSEWDLARTRLLGECFGTKPAVVYLEPFDEEEQKQLFEAALPGEDFVSFVKETRRFELHTLLGNPEFLQLFGEAYVQGGRQFTSKRQIFVDAIARLTRERGDSPKQNGRAPIQEIIETGEEIFAKLLLSGASGVSFADDPTDRDFPYLASLIKRSQALAKDTIDTRLFKPGSETGTHEPVHRIVAEYCAAQYLVRRLTEAGDALSARRVFAVIAPNGVVRNELRGLLGWMAALGEQSLQAKCITIDPYAVLANGDPSQLVAPTKRLLLERLLALSEVDPHFRRSDSWRRFSVARFFDDATLDLVKRELMGKPTHSELRDLFLELLHGSDAIEKLVPELRQLALDPDQPHSTRLRVLRLLWELPQYDYRADFSALINLGDRTSLRITAECCFDLPAGQLDRQDILALLSSSGKLSEKRKRRNEQFPELRYYLGKLIAELPLNDASWLLDEITRALGCTCGAEDVYDCDCMQSISRIVGQLLDRYFSLAPKPHDPIRIWGWVRSLRFNRAAAPNQSTSVAALQEDKELRHAIHRIAFADAQDADQTWRLYIDLSMSHRHSGLGLSTADLLAMAEYGFESNNIGLWEGLYGRHNRWNTSAGQHNELRTRMRAHSRAKPAFLRVWSKHEHDAHLLEKRDKRRWPDRRQAFERRETKKRTKQRNYFRANHERIISGRHWGALVWIADQYLVQPKKLAEYLDDVTDADKALCACFDFLKPHLPSLASLVDNSYNIVRVLHAAVLAHFRLTGGLEGIDTDILLIVKTDLGGYGGYREGESERFAAAINSQALPTAIEAEKFARTYLEPQLLRDPDAATRVSWLKYDEVFLKVKAKLSVEWLDRYQHMPFEARETLFDICVDTLGGRELISLVERNCARELTSPIPSNGENKVQNFWFLRALFFIDNPPNAVWAQFRSNPNAIFAIEAKVGRLWRSDNPTWPDLTADKIYRILDMYIDVWPRVELPNNYGTGDPPEETAYRFLTDIVWRIDNSDPRNSIPALDRLLADSRFANFRDTLRSQRASAMRKNALRDFTPPSPVEIVGLLDEGRLTSIEALRALLVEELEAIGRWARYTETNPLRTFYSGSKHVDENTARDRIVDRLQVRMAALNLNVNIERYMADQNRCDITISAMISGRHQLLVIEVKGQWNDTLYTAASTQLFQRYSMHPDAAEQGIYLALWFGPNISVAGKMTHSITTSSELYESIRDKISEDLHGRIDVVVIDLSQKPQKANNIRR